MSNIIIQNTFNAQPVLADKILALSPSLFCRSSAAALSLQHCQLRPSRIARPMEALARITMQRHDSDQGALESRIPPAQTLQCFRVLGKSAQTAGMLCRKRLESGVFPPMIALTLEHLKSIKPAHIAVCVEVSHICQSLRRDLYLCGISDENREKLRTSGLLEEIDPRNIFPSVAALLDSFSANPRQGRIARTGPSPTGKMQASRNAPSPGVAVPLICSPTCSISFVEC